MKEIKYCNICWAKLKKKIVRADKLIVDYYDWFWVTGLPLWYRYHELTWKEQYWYKLVCPNKKWYNSHTEYIDGNQKLFTK